MDIEKHLNVLNKKEQSSILKLVDKKLTKIFRGSGLSHPGLQTYSDLHQVHGIFTSDREYLQIIFLLRLFSNRDKNKYYRYQRAPLAQLDRASVF